jgi:hypothetical protein
MKGDKMKIKLAWVVFEKDYKTLTIYWQKIDAIKHNILSEKSIPLYVSLGKNIKKQKRR